MSAEPLPTPAHIRLVDENGEVHSDCPGCAQRDERIERLLEVQEGLSTRLGTTETMLTKLKRELHRDMGLEPKAALVKRVYATYVRVLHPKTTKKRREEMPSDWLKMGLQRAEDFTEAEMLQAVYGADTEWARNAKTGRVYDKWNNIFNSTGQVEMYMGFYERKQEQLRRKFPYGVHVAGVLRAASLYDATRSTDMEVRASCPVCGAGFLLDVRSGLMWCQKSCEDADVQAAIECLAETYGLEAA